MKRFVIGTAVVLALAAVLYAATTAQTGAECEVCMAFEGRSRCSRVAAATRAEAEQRAVAHACGVLTSGVTRSLQCQRTPPLSIDCRD